MAPSILTLPPEMVENIAFQLEGRYDDPASPAYQDLFNLRLTCAEMQAKTRHAFIEVHFRFRALRLDIPMLEELVAISKVQDLAASVRLLQIHCEDDRPDRLDSRDIIDPQDFETVITTNVFRYSDTAARAAPYLAVAFDRLRNLEIINLVDDMDEDPFPVSSGHFNIPKHDITSNLAVVASAINACNVSLRELTMNTFDMRDLRKLSLGLSTDLVVHDFPKLLTGLETLTLRLADLRDSQERQDYLGPMIGQQLARAASTASNLQKLFLDTGFADHSAELLSEMLQSESLPKLKTFVLSSALLRLADLDVFLRRRSSHITTFCVHGLKFLDATEAGVREFLETLRDHMKLATLLLNCLLTPEGFVSYAGMQFGTIADRENEDGYIEIDHIDVRMLPLLDAKDIHEGLTDALSCLRVGR